MSRDFEPMAQAYSMFEVISALQKECRRGNAEDALYWAMCLLERYEDYLWRRLIVICVEDIGVGNPDCLVRVRACRDTYFEMRSWKCDSWTLPLAQAIQVICESVKSRSNNYLQCVTRAQIDQAKQGKAEWKPIPDYALDKHTRRGKAMGRGTEHFRTEAALLVPARHESDPWREQAEAYWDAGYPLKDNWKLKPLPTGKQPTMEQASLFE